MLRFAIALCLALLTTPLRADEDLSCDASQPLACWTLGWLYSEGNPPFPKDEDLAQQLMEIGRQGAAEICETGDTRTCLDLTIAAGEALEGPSFATITNLFMTQAERNCNQGEAIACYERASLYLVLPEEFLRRIASEQGQPPLTTQQLIADEERYLQFARTSSKADKRQLRLGCQDQDPTSCAKLAYLLDLETRTIAYSEEIPDLSEMLEAANFACMNGIDQGCETLWMAASFLKPRRNFDTTRVDKMRLRLHAQCYEGQHAGSCFALFAFGEMAAAPQSENETAVAYACEFGNANACLVAAAPILGSYYTEDGGPQALKRATEFFAKGCELRNATACHFAKHLSKG